VDKPFATFKYLYRTWEQLQDLGVLGNETQGFAKEDDLPVIEPCEDSVQGEEARNISRASDKDTDEVFYECSDGVSEANRAASCLSNPARSASTRSGSPLPKGKLAVSEQPRTYIPRGAPAATKEASGEQANKQTRQRHSGMRTPPQFYRLSVPPSVKLEPPQQTSRPLPSVPQKLDSSSSTSYHPHPAYPVEEWKVCTPSPVRSTREGISTPPLERRKGQGFRAASFMSAISATWKQRGAWSSGTNGGTDDQGGSRSVSH
jgi:hypothetical protein